MPIFRPILFFCFFLVVSLESFKVQSYARASFRPYSSRSVTLRCQESDNSESSPDSIPSESSPDSMPSYVEDTANNRMSDGQSREDILALKNKLFALSAVCDRGFGALPSDRKAIDEIVDQLRNLDKDKVYTRNLYPNNSNDGIAPLEGNWKLVYTTALDVLSLAASPLTLLQGIYQSIKKDGSSVNVIDLAPRIQVAFPPSLVGLGSTLRLKVFTSASARSDKRVGLTFRRVEAKPLSLFGQSLVGSSLPTLKYNLPQAALFGSDVGEKGLTGQDQGGGFFDILYLDQDCLIITQNAPGGIFISVRDNEAGVDFF
jgi:hypothetical protein